VKNRFQRGELGSQRRHLTFSLRAGILHEQFLPLHVKDYGQIKWFFASIFSISCDVSTHRFENNFRFVLPKENGVYRKLQTEDKFRDSMSQNDKLNVLLHKEHVAVDEGGEAVDHDASHQCN